MALFRKLLLQTIYSKKRKEKQMLLCNIVTKRTLKIIGVSVFKKSGNRLKKTEMSCLVNLLGVRN